MNKRHNSKIYKVGIQKGGPRLSCFPSLTTYQIKLVIVSYQVKLLIVSYYVQDVMKFMVTFVPIFLAFMVGMYNLYWYYDPSVRNIVEIVDHKINTKAQEGFGT